ncbi:MAG: zinc ribbon domain-containing protein [Clostridium sp.]
MKCDKCGKEMRKNAIFCDGCGIEVNSDLIDEGKDKAVSLGIKERLTLHLKIAVGLFILGIIGLCLDWVKVLGIDELSQSGLALGGIVILMPFTLILVISIAKIFFKRIINITLDVVSIIASGFIFMFMVTLYTTISKVPAQTETLGIGLYLTIAVSLGFLINSFYGIYGSIKNKY